MGYIPTGWTICLPSRNRGISRGELRSGSPEEELDQLKTALAAAPTAGDIIPGGGGLRKLRWGREGTGKRGGVRVIHYYYDQDVPLFLLDIFAKNEADDLTAAELRELAAAAKAIARSAKRHKRGAV